MTQLYGLTAADVQLLKTVARSVAGNSRAVGGAGAGGRPAGGITQVRLGISDAINETGGSKFYFASPFGGKSDEYVSATVVQGSPKAEDRVLLFCLENGQWFTYCAPPASFLAVTTAAIPKGGSGNVSQYFTPGGIPKVVRASSPFGAIGASKQVWVQESSVVRNTYTIVSADCE